MMGYPSGTDAADEWNLFSGDTEMFRDLYNSLLNTQNGGDRADRYFILTDFRSYAEHRRKWKKLTKMKKAGLRWHF